MAFTFEYRVVVERGLGVETLYLAVSGFAAAVEVRDSWRSEAGTTATWIEHRPTGDPAAGWEPSPISETVTAEWA